MALNFDTNKVRAIYPEATMIDAMRIWSLPKHKEHELQKHCESGEYFGQIKKDGYFYQFNKTENHSYLFSRNTSVNTGLLTEKIANVPHIEKALSILPNDTIVIGEVYIPNKTSKDVTRIMGCLPAEAIKRQESEGQVHFYIHDIIAFKGKNLIDVEAEKRYVILKTVFDMFSLANNSFIELAEKYDTNLFELVGTALENGEEGVVLKKKDAPYAPGRKPAWSAIKCKKVDYADVVCMGVEDATKDYDGKELETWQYWEDKTTGEKVLGQMFNSETPMIPVTKPYFYGWKTSIRIGAYTKEGSLKEIGTCSSGLTDELRKDLAVNTDNYIGKVVEIQCMEKSKQDQTFRHPIMKRFRDDKNPSECTLEELF